MRRNWIPLPTVALIAVLLSACADSTGPGPVDVLPVDEISPEVVSVLPSAGSTDVGVDHAVLIEFSEPMARAFPADGFEMSHGEILRWRWTSDTRLRVDHSGWPHDADVSITVGRVFAARGGNRTVDSVTIDFRTEPSADFGEGL